MQRLNPRQLSVNVSLKLPIVTAAHLDRLAVVAGVSKSDIIRSALTSYCALLGLEKRNVGRRT